MALKESKNISIVDIDELPLQRRRVFEELGAEAAKEAAELEEKHSKS